MPARRRRALVLAALLAGCGGGGPAQPGPLPSATPAGAEPGGVLAGAYTLTVQPSSTCARREPLVYVMEAAAAGTSPHPGVQAVLSSLPRALELEVELIEGGLAVRGGLGTTEAGAAADEGRHGWIHAIAAGHLTRGLGGRGEILSGTLLGTVGLGTIVMREDEASLCTAEHTFSLRAR